MSASSSGAKFEREPLALGESIAVDGVCLTVAAIVKNGPEVYVFEADASAETLEKTTIGDLAIGATSTSSAPSRSAGAWADTSSQATSTASDASRTRRPSAAP